MCQSFLHCESVTESVVVTLSNVPVQAEPPRACCPGRCPDSFWIPPRREISQPPWAACASAQSLSCWKKCFLMFVWNLLCFGWFPVLLVLSQATAEKCLALSSTYPPYRYRHILIRCPLSLL